MLVFEYKKGSRGDREPVVVVCDERDCTETRKVSWFYDQATMYEEIARLGFVVGARRNLVDASLHYTQDAYCAKHRHLLRTEDQYGEAARRRRAEAAERERARLAADPAEQHRRRLEQQERDARADRRDEERREYYRSFRENYELDADGIYQRRRD